MRVLILGLLCTLYVMGQNPDPVIGVGGGGGVGGGSGATSLDGLTDVQRGNSPPGTCTDNTFYIDESEAVGADVLKVCKDNNWYKVSELTAGDYIDITGRTISLSTSIPIYSTSTSDGSGACTAGREWHLNTSSGALWWCQSSGTWKAIMISGTANEITLTGSTLSIASAFDISGKTSTKSVKTGTSAPGTCAQGELFIDTDATAASQLLVCTATNTWTAQGGSSGGGGVIVFAEQTGIAQALTRYASPGATIGHATEATRQITMPRAGTMKNLYVRTLSNIGGSGDTWVTTVRKNAADTSLTCTISTGAASCSDTDAGHAVSFAAGDLFTFKFVSSATTGTHFPNAVVSFE